MRMTISSECELTYNLSAFRFMATIKGSAEVKEREREMEREGEKERKGERETEGWGGGQPINSHNLQMFMFVVVNILLP